MKCSCPFYYPMFNRLDSGAPLPLPSIVYQSLTDISPIPYFTQGWMKFVIWPLFSIPILFETPSFRNRAVGLYRCPLQIWWNSGHVTLRSIWEFGFPWKMGRAKSINRHNSSVHCPTVLKFGRLSHCWVLWADFMIKKPRMTGGTVGLKWQCSANCHLF